ncbi:MAG: InlB B-repeat-containing protein, partial [Ilumatobacteraceae bacterium]
MDKNLLQVSTIQPRTATANVYKWLVSIVLILVSVSVTQVSTERVARATELTCAEGGACEVGHTGPGGGIVFYVHASGTFSCREEMASQCNYLEAAPVNWLTGSSGDPQRSWASNDNNIRLGTTLEVLGSGYQNSIAIVLQGGNTADDSAAVLSRGYSNNGLADWYLPSKIELGFLQDQKARLSTNNVDSYNTYWSSSELTGATEKRVWVHSFARDTWNSKTSPDKSALHFVRPIRAFSDLQQSTYTVSFDGNGSTGGSVPGNQTKTHGLILTLSSNTGSLVKTGYTFGGWNSAANGSGTSYAAGASYEENAAV